MELSSIELGYLIRELNDALTSYYVSSIQYVNERSILLRLHHSLKPEQRLIISAGRGIWVTRYDLSQDQASGLLSFLRRELVRAKLLGMEQPGSERIVFINFESQHGLRRLTAEFFGDGNLILTDGDGRILSLLKPLKVRHRELKRGCIYTLPPSRGLDVAKVTLEDLKPLQSSNLEVARWMGRNLSLSKRYIDEVLARSGIDLSIKGEDLNDESLQRLYNHIQEIIFAFNSKALEPVLVYDGGRPIDASPIVLRSYAALNWKRVDSFQEAVDEVFASELLEDRRKLDVEPIRQKLGELEVSIAEQQKVREELQRGSQTLRFIAKGLSETFATQEDLPRLLLSLGAESATIRNGRLSVTVRGYTFEYDQISSTMKLSSQIFDKAKEMQEKLKAVESAEQILISKRDELLQRLQSFKTRPETPERQREKAWFERFRWFITSEGLLSIGGRDASSNSAVIRKHTEASDLIFHADLHGSPFFILKKGDSSKAQSILETAQAVVSFSSAWKDGLHSADAYWVKPEQVKRQAPSGMYLPKGSFLIEGARNYLKNLEVKVSIGVDLLEGSLVVVSGPPSAIQKNSLAYVTLTPDKVKPSNTAKQAKVELIRLMEGEFTDRLKRLSLDEFLKALPPGGGRIISRGVGERKVLRSLTG